MIDALRVRLKAETTCLYVTVFLCSDGQPAVNS